VLPDVQRSLAASIDGLQWAEVDFLHDLDRAQAVVDGWSNQPLPLQALRA
jgi:choline kinase